MNDLRKRVIELLTELLEKDNTLSEHEKDLIKAVIIFCGKEVVYLVEVDLYSKD